MSNHNLYDSIIEVFSPESEIYPYMESKSNENWKKCNNEESFGQARAWINDKGNILLENIDERFFTLFENIESCLELINYENNQGTLGYYSGFGKDFLDRKDTLIDSLFKKYNIPTPPKFNKNELNSVAEACAIDAFDTELYLSGVVAYCGEYIVCNFKEYTWCIESITSGEITEYLPCLLTPDNEKYIIPYELLNAIDKGYSNEFVWGGIPIELQTDL